MGEASEREVKETEEAGTAASIRKKLEENNYRLTSELVAEAIELAFPDFKCLRCQNEEFLVGTTTGVDTFRPKRKFVSFGHTDIICARCGMIESHSPIVLISTLLGIRLEAD